MDEYISKPFSGAALRELLINRWQSVQSRSESLQPLENPAAAEPIVAVGGEAEVVTSGAIELPARISRKVLQELREVTCEETVSGVIESFLKSAPKHAEAARKAISDTDPDQLRRAAHSLRGTSGLLGANSVAAVCQHLEEIGKSGSTSGAEEWLGRLETEIERISEPLRTKSSIYANRLGER